MIAASGARAPPAEAPKLSWSDRLLMRAASVGQTIFAGMPIAAWACPKDDKAAVAGKLPAATTTEAKEPAILKSTEGGGGAVEAVRWRRW